MPHESGLTRGAQGYLDSLSVRARSVRRAEALMSDDDVATQILAFATHLCEPGTASGTPEGAARVRGWLDDEGRPTDTGRELVDAIREQRATRSVIRNV
jgi:hypothetical protein